MKGQFRDILIYVAAMALALCAAAIARQFVGAKWEGPIVVTAIFAAASIVKLRWPNNVVVRQASWVYLALTFVIAEFVAAVLSDWTLVGYWWTLPTVIMLGLAYCVVHLMFGPRYSGR